MGKVIGQFRRVAEFLESRPDRRFAGKPAQFQLSQS